MITEGGYGVEILKDGWTVVTADGKLAAHFEHTIAVTEEGPKILTLRDHAEHKTADRYRPAQEAIVMSAPLAEHRYQNTLIEAK